MKATATPSESSVGKERIRRFSATNWPFCSLLDALKLSLRAMFSQGALGRHARSPWILLRCGDHFLDENQCPAPARAFGADLDHLF